MKYLIALLVFFAVGGACRPSATSPHTGREMSCSESKSGRAYCSDGERSYLCITDFSGCNVQQCGLVAE